MLTSHDISSLVVDRLCDQAKGQNIAVTCLYFDFAARKEQSVTNMLALAETDCWRNRKGSRGDITGLSRAENGHRWTGTATSRCGEDATDHHNLTAHICMH